jgi:hypothetical protein
MYFSPGFNSDQYKSTDVIQCLQDEKWFFLWFLYLSSLDVYFLVVKISFQTKACFRAPLSNRNSIELGTE